MSHQQEVVESKPWLMANEPVDLEYDTWFPTDWLSANLRQKISVIFPEFSQQQRAQQQQQAGQSQQQQQAGEGAEVAHSMEVDQVSDGEGQKSLCCSYTNP